MKEKDTTIRGALAIRGIAMRISADMRDAIVRVAGIRQIARRETTATTATTATAKESAASEVTTMTAGASTAAANESAIRQRQTLQHVIYDIRFKSFYAADVIATAISNPQKRCLVAQPSPPAAYLLTGQPREEQQEVLA